MGSLIIVVGPSGAGKSSFVEKAVEEIPKLVDVITCTTRNMRNGEKQGYPYHFFSKEEFEQKIKEDFFVEYAQVHGNFYGTPRDQIEKSWDEGRTPIMDVDIQGAQTFIQKYPEAVRSIFIIPPSIDELRKRIIARDSRDGNLPKDLELRLENGKREIERADQFDVQIVNDQFDEAFAQFKKIIENIVSQG